jgi:arginine N-succinyltransferase
MLVVRAISEQDLDGLLTLTLRAGSGMTTLKPDRKVLAQRLEIACASFAEKIAPPQRDYMFVMENTASGELVGVCAIKSAVGMDEPFYNYRIGTLVHSSNELKVFTRMDTLYLSNDLTGCAEVCSLFLHPDYRQGSNGKLLSKSRFMFIAQHPHLFSQKLIAEMRGYLDASGKSPFWESLGRHFFKMDFDRADDLTGLGQKSFIAELMPRHPLYVAYLPKEARDVIGAVQRETAPARRLLEQEGMYYEGYVDVFDAGPVLQARVSELRAVRESRLCTVTSGHPATDDGELLLVASTGMQDFRVIVAHDANEAGAIQLNAQQQELLRWRAGDSVRAMSLNLRKTNHA